MVPKELCNPVKPLPPEEGAFDTYKKYGYLMFPQQRTIYSNIAKRIDPHSTVLEVGCGIGLGTAILDRSLTTKVVGTDNLIENVKMARALYPWITFNQMDICSRLPTLIRLPDIVVAVEVLEHVENPRYALTNMCLIAQKEVWLSTPNGIGKKRPPDNPYHCCEYTVNEVNEMIPNGWNLKVLEYQDFKAVNSVIVNNGASPLVYHLTKKN